MFKRAVERFIPPLPDASEELVRRTRLVAYAIFITALFALFYVIVSLVAGSVFAALINFISSVLFMGMLVLLRGGVSAIRVANLFGLFGIFNIVVCIYLDKGLHSPIMPWLATTPIIILLLAGKKSGYFWALVSVLLVAVFALLDYYGYVFPETFFNATTFYYFSCHVGVVLIIFVISVVFENVRIRAFNAVSHQKDKLQFTLNELKAAQSQLIQSEKMASLGELTAGIAHEIQNPLNFVNNFSELNTELMDELTAELAAGNSQAALELVTNLRENEQKIVVHGKRAEAIVKSMLQHSKVNAGKKAATDLHELVEESLRFSYNGWKAKDKTFDTAIQTTFEDNIGTISVVPQDISRLLLNLFNNAFYAVNEKKKQLNGGYMPVVSVSTARDENGLLIKISDNGIGIPAAIRDKIFQPFFTTKPTGQGTGLGLSLSYDIVQAHDGDIQVESHEGEGSDFYIRLPVA